MDLLDAHLLNAGPREVLLVVDEVPPISEATWTSNSNEMRWLAGTEGLYRTFEDEALADGLVSPERYEIDGETHQLLRKRASRVECYFDSVSLTEVVVASETDRGLADDPRDRPHYRLAADRSVLREADLKVREPLVSPEQDERLTQVASPATV